MNRKKRILNLVSIARSARKGMKWSSSPEIYYHYHSKYISAQAALQAIAKGVM